MKTMALIGVSLNRWVAKAIGCDPSADWRPAEDWSQGGPIIEREGLCICNDQNGWHATSNAGTYYGPTPLVAAMRSYVAAEFGDDVEN